MLGAPGVENVMDGIVAAVVQDIHCWAFHDDPSPTHDDVRLVGLDDPSLFLPHLSDWPHAHEYEETVEMGYHLVVPVQQVARTAGARKEIGCR